LYLIRMSVPRLCPVGRRIAAQRRWGLLQLISALASIEGA